MEKENIGFNKNGLSREEVEIAYEKTIFMFTILLWVVMSYGCSNQQDSTAINEKLEMIIEDEVISKEDPGVTEEILADGMDLSIQW